MKTFSDYVEVNDLICEYPGELPADIQDWIDAAIMLKHGVQDRAKTSKPNFGDVAALEAAHKLAVFVCGRERGR